MLYAAREHLMGTRLDVVLLDVDEADAKALWEECVTDIEKLEATVSRFNPGSEVSLVNRSEPLSTVAVSPGFREILDLASEMCRLTEGTFDVTLGDGSHFSYDASGALLIPSGGLKIDMGGLAKGFAVDRMCRRLKNAGVKRAFISFGGSSIAGLGSHPGGESWRVSIADPFTGHPLRTVDLRDESLSTSGNSKEYRGHIIDPATGRAVTGRRLSAIVAPSAIDAEVLSTAWLVADADTRRRILNNFSVKEEFVYN